ncbi:MAG: hypothetical protein OXK73_17610 [Rhodospirillaceae bacterium]|nr:hypothetical protein [Rhodospirillaceae bacterium]
MNAGCAAGVAAALLATTLLASSPAAQELVPFPVASGDEPLPIVNAPVEAPPETAVAPAAAGPDLDAATAALVTMLTGPPAEGPTMADCAIELLRTRLASAVAGEDVLTAVALENELLRLCQRRQQLVADVLHTELLLASLAAGEAETGPSLPVETPPPPAAPAATLLDQLAEATLPPTEPEPWVDQAPPYTWFNILGMAGNLRAAVTDGTQVWWVREGESLPGGWRVVHIANTPPGVSLHHIETGDWALAHGSAGGG